MKKVGVPATPLASALRTSSATRAAYSRRCELVAEALDVEAELAGVAVRDRGRKPALVGEQPVVHRPRTRPARRGLGRLGRRLRVGCTSLSGRWRQT
jgi:hypothetical protein